MVGSSVKKRFLKHTSVRALLLLDAGNYPSRVARVLGFSPQVLHYHVKKWLKLGWIKLEVKTPNMTSYKLEPSVKKSLTGGEVLPFKGVRLHAYSLKFPVLDSSGSAVDWNRVQMANWTRLVGCECGLTVEKTTKHVIVHADEVLSEDPNEATLLAILECLRLARVLEEKFGMKLGTPKLLRKPHFAVSDPVARWFTDFMELSSDVGKMDQSEGAGKIDYYDAELAKEYLIMPLRMLDLQGDMAEVRRLSDEEACLLAMRVNQMHGKRLEELEEGLHIKKMMEQFGYTQTDVGKRFKKTQAWVSYRLALVERLAPETREALITRVIERLVAVTKGAQEKLIP